MSSLPQPLPPMSGRHRLGLAALVAGVAMLAAAGVALWAVEGAAVFAETAFAALMMCL